MEDCQSPHPDLGEDPEWETWMAQLRSASGLEESEDEEQWHEEWEEEEVEVEAEVLSDEEELPPIPLPPPPPPVPSAPARSAAPKPKKRRVDSWVLLGIFVLVCTHLSLFLLTFCVIFLWLLFWFKFQV